MSSKTSIFTEKKCSKKINITRSKYIKLKCNNAHIKQYIEYLIEKQIYDKNNKILSYVKKSKWCKECNQCKAWYCDNCGDIEYITAFNHKYELCACSEKCVIELNNKITRLFIENL